MGVQPDLKFYNSLINVYIKNKNLSAAKSIISEMKLSGIVPDVVTMNTLLNGYSALGDASGFYQIYEKMEENGIQPTIRTENALLYLHFVRKDYQKVKEYYYENILEKTNIQPDEVT